MFGRSRFYKDGIRFECQDCGGCCLSRGEYAYVYLKAYDRKRLADFLRISTRDFTIRYTGKTDGILHLKDPDKDCLFLQDGRCSVYEARPRQCRSWPFWPENMKKKVWERDIASYCKGVGKGKLHSAEEIERIIEREREFFER
jgi:Fe-S-cluster containining protein